MASFIFDATSKSRFYLGNQGGQGHETPRTLLCIDVTRCDIKRADAVKEGKEAEVVQIYLAIPQMVEIVMLFFRDVVSPGNIYTKLLQRLLKRRWDVMTDSLAKTTSFSDNGRPWLPRYDRIEA